MSFDDDAPDAPDAPVLVIGSHKLNPRKAFPDSILASGDTRIFLYNYVLSEELYSELAGKHRKTDVASAAVLTNGIVSRLTRTLATGAATFQTADILNKGAKTDAGDNISTVTRYTLKCNTSAISGNHLCLLGEWKKTTVTAVAVAIATASSK
jgi:hypothetical protein